MENQISKFTSLDNFFNFFFLFNLLIIICEKKAIKNTINGLELFFNSLCFGLIIAIVFLVILIYQKPLIYSQSKRKLILVFQIFFSIMLFITSTSNFINRNLSFEIEDCKNQSILKMDFDSGSGRRFYSKYSINFKIDNEVV